MWRTRRRGLTGVVNGVRVAIFIRVYNGNVVSMMMIIVGIDPSNITTGRDIVALMKMLM